MVAVGGGEGAPPDPLVRLDQNYRMSVGEKEKNSIVKATLAKAGEVKGEMWPFWCSDDRMVSTIGLCSCFFYFYFSLCSFSSSTFSFSAFSFSSKSFFNFSSFF